MSFGEEVVRGQTVFTLSWMLSELEKHLRVAAGAGAWQVCAAGGTGSQFWGGEGGIATTNMGPACHFASCCVTMRYVTLSCRQWRST